MVKVVSIHFGSGGGHIFGGLTLWQFFKIKLSEPFHFLLLTNSMIEFPPLDGTLEVLYIEPEPDKLFYRDRETVLYQYLKHIDPDIIIVDNIWFPMKKILHDFRAKSVIYFWFLPPTWFTTPPLNDGETIQFEPEDYNLAFTIDPFFELPGCENLPPVINVHENLIQPPDVIRSILNVPGNKKLALIAHNGHKGEIDEIMKKADIDPEEYCQRSVSSFDDVSRNLFPLSHYLSGVDLAIGGCGYHFFYETKFFKIPSLYFPLSRLGNEQHWRLEHCQNYEGPYDGADQMVQKIMELL